MASDPEAFPEGEPAAVDPQAAAPDALAETGEAPRIGTPAGAPPRAARQPVWTFFLTPIAVVIGSFIIAGAVWITSDDNGNTPPASSAAGSATRAPAQAPGTAPPAAAAPTTLLAALTSYAQQIGLDQQKFTQCLGNSQNAALINRQLQRGAALGVNGTPTFFVNNKMIVGAQPGAIFDEVITAELLGSPTSLDGYSDAVKQLAGSSPPRFAIVQGNVDVSDAIIEGSPGAKVMIAEFSDFQCPFCKRWVDDNMSRIRTRLGNDVAFAFLHFPLAQIHPNAGNASLAAICAGEQGKFPQMHDLLFQHQNDWSKLAAE